MIYRWVLLAMIVHASALNAADVDLRAQIDALVNTSSVVGQNRGWSSQASADPKKGVRFDLGLTAARGLILLRAARLGVAPDLDKVADGIARALMAAQQRSGYVPMQATYLRGGARAETDPSPILPRQATDAAIAFLLAYSHAAPTTQPRADQSAKSAINWLIQQQLGVGGFLAPTTQPNTGLHPVRQIDLTTIDYRNALLTLLLANRYERSKPLELAAEKAANRLLALRLMNQAGSPATNPVGDDTDAQRKTKAALQLWAGRYEAAGDVANDGTDASIAAASQSLQSLLAAALASDNPHWPNELQTTAAALRVLEETHEWLPAYPALPTTRPSTQPTDSVFGPQTIKPVAETFNLPTVLEFIEQSQVPENTDLVKELERSETLEDRLAATIVGLRVTLLDSADTPDGRLWKSLHP